MKKKISKCPTSGLAREAEFLGLQKNLKLNTANVGVQVSHLDKEGNVIKSRGLKPFAFGVQIKNDDEGKSWDTLIEGKTDEQIFTGAVEFADKKGLFDK